MNLKTTGAAIIAGLFALFPASAAAECREMSLSDAVQAGDLACVERLIEAGAEVNAWSSYGWTALHVAARSTQNPAIIEALLDAGADPNMRTARDVYDRSRDPMTPLDVADRQGEPNLAAGYTIRRWIERQQAERARQAAAARLAEQRRQEALDREAAAQERELERLRLQLAIAQLQAAASVEAGADSDDAPPPAPLPAAAGPGCLIPGYPDPSNLSSLGFAWCPGDVDFQIRAYALQAAGAWCAITGGTSATPEQLVARHAEINETCDRLDAVGAALGDTRCDCDLDSRVRP